MKKVSFSSAFKRSLKKIDSKIQDKFFERLDIFINDPFDSVLNNHGLSGKKKGYRSINISGDVRAIYKDMNKIAYFVEIGNHSNLYK